VKQDLEKGMGLANKQDAEKMVKKRETPVRVGKGKKMTRKNMDQTGMGDKPGKGGPLRRLEVAERVKITKPAKRTLVNKRKRGRGGTRTGASLHVIDHLAKQWNDKSEYKQHKRSCSKGEEGLHDPIRERREGRMGTQILENNLSGLGSRNFAKGENHKKPLRRPGKKKTAGEE